MLSDEKELSGYIGRIPVRNIWLLMLYASDLYRTHGRRMAGVEESVDRVADLVAEILIPAVRHRMRYRLGSTYKRKTANLSRIRGKIDHIRTARQQLLTRGLVACAFFDLDVDRPRNRFVRSALEKLSPLVTKESLRHDCRNLVNALRMLGVVGPCPTKAELSADRLARHDVADREMLDAAKLVMDLVLPTEQAGDRLLPMPYREETRVRLLFERAVGGFYRVALSPGEWQVSTGTKLNWAISSSSAGARAFIPQMKTDIILESVLSTRRIIIDTKFNEIAVQGHYRERTFRSEYLYQIYAYLMSQTGRGDPLADSAAGLLLHPSIGETIDEAIKVQGHVIRFATVDLAADAVSIRQRLLELIDEWPL